MWPDVWFPSRLWEDNKTQAQKHQRVRSHYCKVPLICKKGLLWLRSLQPPRNQGPHPRSALIGPCSLSSVDASPPLSRSRFPPSVSSAPEPDATDAARALLTFSSHDSEPRRARTGMLGGGGGGGEGTTRERIAGFACEPLRPSAPAAGNLRKPPGWGGDVHDSPEEERGLNTKDRIRVKSAASNLWNGVKKGRWVEKELKKNVEDFSTTARGQLPGALTIKPSRNFSTQQKQQSSINHNG